MIRKCDSGVLIWVDYDKDLAKSGRYDLCVAEQFKLLHDLFCDLVFMIVEIVRGKNA